MAPKWFDRWTTWAGLAMPLMIAHAIATANTEREPPVIIAQKLFITLVLPLHYIGPIYSGLRKVTPRSIHSDTATEQCPDMIAERSNVSVVGETLSVSRQTGRLEAGCSRAVIQQYTMSGYRQ